jgi:hypothetical protein
MQFMVDGSFYKIFADRELQIFAMNLEALNFFITSHLELNVYGNILHRFSPTIVNLHSIIHINSAKLPY